MYERAQNIQPLHRDSRALATTYTRIAHLVRRPIKTRHWHKAASCIVPATEN